MIAFNTALNHAAQPCLRWAGRVAALLVIGAGCTLLAGLLWGFALPQPAPVLLVSATPTAVAGKLAATPLFATPPEARATESVVASDWRLLGVLSSGSPSSAARAVITGAGQPQVLAIGDELSPGVRLTRIEPQQVILTSLGRESVLALPQPATAAKADPD